MGYMRLKVVLLELVSCFLRKNEALLVNTVLCETSTKGK
jgi:hypothetical protein